MEADLDNTTGDGGKKRTGNKKYLCRYHAYVCDFLDERHQEETRGGGGGGGGRKGGKADSANTESESAKYLPRKAPPSNLAAAADGGGGSGSATLMDSQRDLMVVRATSSLLQELWDGKLKSTLRTFTKKVVLDMGIRRRMEQFANQLFSRLNQRNQKLLLGVADGSIVIAEPGQEPTTPRLALDMASEIERGGGKERKSAAAVAKEAKIKRQEQMQNARDATELIESLGRGIEVLLRAGVATGPPPPPSWAMWKNGENLTRVLTSQSTITAALEGIMKVEAGITQELQRLADLRAFPGNELAIIKKEVKAHKAAHATMIERMEALEAAKEKALKSSKGKGRGKGETAFGGNSSISSKWGGGKGGDDIAYDHPTAAVAVLHLRHAEDYVAMIGAEYRLCERKLSILRAKRMEEAAAYAHQERRQAKRAARQEEQQRDPANFGFR
jgi:hypothetical protein